MDYEPGSAVRAKKKQRDRLIRRARTNEDWALGFLDEVWWSRLAQPRMHAWGRVPLRLVEKKKDKADVDPVALACYGVFFEQSSPMPQQMLLRFVKGRPVSQVTTAFLAWILAHLAAQGKQVWVLIWDNASWHISGEVRRWIKAHNAKVKREGGVRLLVCALPVQSPWLNPIEPRWLHGKRAIVEPDRKLTARETMERICAHYGCELLEPIQQNVS